MGPSNNEERSRRDETVPNGSHGDDQSTVGNMNVSTTPAHVRSLGSASGVFPADVLESPASPTFPTTPSNLPDPMRPHRETNNVGGSVMAGMFGGDSEEENASDHSVGLDDSISQALDTPTSDRRIADATSVLLGRRLNMAVDKESVGEAETLTVQEKSSSASTPATAVTSPASDVISNDDDSLAGLDADSVTAEEVSGLREDEMIKGLMDLRDIVREARVSNRNESDGALSFLEAFYDVVETIASSATDAGNSGKLGIVSAATTDIYPDDSGFGNAYTGPNSPSSVSSFEEKIISDRHLHRRMMSRDGRQGFDISLQTEAENLTRTTERHIIIPPSHPIRKLLPYIPHLHAIFVKIQAQLAWLTGPSSSIEHKAVASRIVQLLEYLSEQISLILMHEEDNDSPSLFADGTSSSVAVDSADPSAVAISIGELLGSTEEDEAGGNYAINGAVASFRLVLSVLGDGACIVERIQEENSRKETLESDENYLKIMSLHSEMEQMVELDGGDDLNPMNQRGALAAMKLGKLIVKEAPAPDDGGSVQQDSDHRDHTTTTLNIPGSNQSAIADELTCEKLSHLLDWMVNVDIILTDLTGTLSTAVIQPRSFGGKYDAVDYLLHKTIPEILSVGALDAAESITAIVAAFIRKRRKIMEILPDRHFDSEMPEDEMDEDMVDLSLIDRVRDALSETFLSRRNKNRSIVILLSIFLYLNYMQLIPTNVSLAFVTMTAIALAKRFVEKIIDSHRPDAFVRMYEFIPELPDTCLPRVDIKRQVMDTIANTAGNMFDSQNKSQDITLICGPPGIGKTILASLVVRCGMDSVDEDDFIHTTFPDGVVWLNMNHPTKRKIDYRTLIALYDAICDQLALVSPSKKLSSLAASFDAELYALRPEVDDGDEYQLMLDLQRDFYTHLQLSSRQILFVLDGLDDIDNAKWFQATKSSSGKFNKFTFWRSHVLATTSVSTQNELDVEHPPHWSRIIEVGLLSDHEANTMLTNESSGQIEKLESIVARGKDWAYTPLCLKCIGHFCSAPVIIFCDSGESAIDSSSKALIKRLAVLSKQACESEEERTLLVVEEGFRHLFTSLGGVGSVLHYCFSAFVGLFYDSASSWSSIEGQYVPTTIATIFWDGLLSSDEIPVENLMEVEKCLAADDNGVSRSSFVADCLVTLGLLRCTSCDLGDRTKITGYAVAHNILVKVALKLQNLGAEMSVLTDDEIDEDRMARKQPWSVTLVQGYQEYLSGIGSRRDRWSKDQAYQEETQFIMRYIVKHMFLGKLSDKGLELLTSESFIQNRLKRLGLLEGTAVHIDDTERLIQTLKERGEIVTLSGKSIVMASAKLSLINSYERIATHLSQVPGIYIEDFVKAAAGLYLLGKSLVSHQWASEAFIMFQESISLCHIVLSYDKKSRNVVYRILERALYQMGEIHKAKGDIGESIKNFTESLHYAQAARRGYRSIELDVMRSLQSLGEAYFLQGDVASALDAQNRCLVSIESQYGQEHRRYADGLENIGIMYIKGKEAKMAISFFIETLELRKRLFGKESLEVAIVLHFLGVAYRDSREDDRALGAFNESIVLWKRLCTLGNGTDGERSTKTRHASCLHELGLLRRQRGEFDLALEAYNEALIIRQTCLGDDNEETAHTLHCIGVVYCDIGAHERALNAYARSLQIQKRIAAQSPRSPRGSTSEMKSFTNALWASPAMRAEAPTPEAIIKRSMSLFGQRIEHRACSAARVFACSSLMVDEMVDNESNTEKKRGDENHKAWLNSMLPYMKAAVEAELAVDKRAKQGSIDDPIDSRRKRLRFCSFDFSAITSPVDMIVGSNEELEHSIDALENVVEEIETLSAGSANANIHTSEKAKLLLVLYAMTTPSEGDSIREACAKAMPDDNGRSWPAARFIQASEIYRAEMEALVASSGREKVEINHHAENEASMVSVSPLRNNFSTQIGFAVRFHLRRLFDPVPMFFTLPSNKYQPPDLSECRAKTYQVVYLRSPDGIQTSADGSDGPAPLWDRPISHVFNLALQRTHAYYDMIEEIQGALTSFESASPTFALSQASQRCLDSRSRDKAVSEMDVDGILNDIQIAHICLSAARAAKFIISLLRWPGVAEAINEAGGWRPVEVLAGKLEKFQLDRDFADEAHFVQLSNIELLLIRLENDREDMLNVARASQKVLQAMWKRFKRGGGRIKRRHTYDAMIRQVLLDDSKTAVFPVLGTPSAPVASPAKG